MPHLKIYKASAGSGKTFRLTGDFIALLFKNPIKYKHILAVTFTNKAAGEMKSRILKHVYILAQGKSSPYIKQIQKSFSSDSDKIQHRAKVILSYILHDYSRFSISTIDTFFQQVIRAFAREMGLQSGFDIELDQDKVLLETTDRLLFRLDDDPELAKWLGQYADSKITEGKSWNFKKDILDLGKEVFKESFKSFDKTLIEKIGQKEFVNYYQQTLFAIKSRFENQMQDYAKQALQLIRNNGLATQDFKHGKSSFANYFNKIQHADYDPTKRVYEANESEENWYKQTSIAKEAILSAYNGGLAKILDNTLSFYDNNYRNYYTATAILSQIYTLGILTDISEEIKNHAYEQNIFLISESAKLLHSIIGNNDAPFVYEKTGAYYHHFMIDEFQDTSHLQWDNFKPLIRNSLADNNDNIIVGDVKQSIYRWRNSDWQLLASQIDADFDQMLLQKETLTYNYRSEKNIVLFNNTAFSIFKKLVKNQLTSDMPEENEALNHLASQIDNAYADTLQSLPDNAREGGYINTSFYEKDGFKHSVLEKVPELIAQLQDKGYNPGDIAILVRKKSEGKEVVNTLLEYKRTSQTHHRFDVISEESLYLSNATAVKCIINSLYYLIHPGEAFFKNILVHEFIRYLKDQPVAGQDLHKFFEKPQANSPGLFENLMPEQLISQQELLRQMPLFELIEELIAILGLNNHQHSYPFLESFQDMVNDYTQKHSSSINSFLEWWEETGKNKTIGLSEEQDAIRILTVHKAKGLEFKTVIIPFCNWKLDNEANIIWCRPQQAPFNNLDLVPVKYNNTMKNSYFADDYYEEKMKSFVDNLNLLYVAFTRAEKNLFVFGELPGRNTNDIKNVSHLLLHGLQSSQPEDDTHTISLNNHFNNEDNTFQFGILEHEKTEKTDGQSWFEPDTYPSKSVTQKLKLRRYGKEYFSFEKEPAYKHLNFGTLMHEAFKNIFTPKDVDKAVSVLLINGLITNDEQETLKQNIRQAINDERVKDWFSEKWNIITETEILLPSGKRVKPDRVLIRDDHAIVIDYKFGEQENKAYNRQLNFYIKQLQRMGYKNTEGYIWYVSLEKIVEVGL